ncbi:hypothetical protein BDR07DRAFT_1430999, partial [Suillus spraguei]
VEDWIVDDQNDFNLLLRTGVASPATFLQCPEEDKVKVQGTRSEYDQGFSLKDKSKRIETKAKECLDLETIQDDLGQYVCTDQKRRENVSAYPKKEGNYSTDALSI